MAENLSNAVEKVAIMQPYFFPYVGYFSLMLQADHFVVFDTPQYDRKGWMHRNRLLWGDGDWKYFNANVKKPPFKAPICEVELKDGSSIEKLMSMLGAYKGRAPFYEETVGLLSRLADETAGCKSLVELNVHCLRAVKDYIGIECGISVFSEMDLELDEVSHAGGWALSITKAMKATDYINPSGATDIFVHDEFAEAGINLSFLKHRLSPYKQLGNEFQASLSILDTMMFLGGSQLLDYVADYELTSAIVAD